jgi:MSHA biogenesis protein MshG
MPVFSYKGRAADGDRVGGRLEADNASAAAQSLIRAGIVPIDVEPVVVRALELKELQRALGLGLPTIEDLVLFTRQLHTVVKAGLPFLSGLRGIAASTQQPVLREALSDIVMHSAHRPGAVGLPVSSSGNLPGTLRPGRARG